MKNTILIVDNNTNYRTSLRNDLTLSGYRVLEASSRREAIEQLDAKPDLAIVDVRLIDDKDPDDFTGFHLVVELKGLPVVILTAHENIEALKKIFALPTDTPPPRDFIFKKDDMRSIVARIQQVLDNLPRKSQSSLWLRRTGLLLSAGLLLFGFYKLVDKDLFIGIISSLAASALIFLIQRYAR